MNKTFKYKSDSTCRLNQLGKLNENNFVLLAIYIGDLGTKDPRLNRVM